MTKFLHPAGSTTGGMHVEDRKAGTMLIDLKWFNTTASAWRGQLVITLPIERFHCRQVTSIAQFASLGMNSGLGSFVPVKLRTLGNRKCSH